MARPAAYLTLAEASDILRLDEKTLRRYVAQGRLSGYRIGPRALRLSAEEVHELARPIPTAG
jgi:excisionase family DNA binding protein